MASLASMSTCTTVNPGDVIISRGAYVAMVVACVLTSLTAVSSLSVLGLHAWRRR